MGRRGSLWYRALTCLRSFLSLFKAITSEPKMSRDAPHPKAFPFLIWVSGIKKKQNLPELSYANVQRGGPRTVFTQWINFHVKGDNLWKFEDHFQNYAVNWWSPSTFSSLKEGVGFVFECCFHSWAVAGINGLKLPSSFAPTAMYQVFHSWAETHDS